LSEFADLRFYLLAIVALALFAALVAIVYRQRRNDQGHLKALREREERLKFALWASAGYYWDYDIASGRIQRLLTDDDDRAATSAYTLDAILHPDDLPLVHERIRRHLAGDDDVFRSVHRTRAPDGGWVWVRTHGRAAERDRDGRILRLAGTAFDITQDRDAEREHRIASQVVRSMSEAVTVLDQDFRFISVNPAFTRITGYEEAEVLGRGAELLNSDQHDPAFYHHIRDIVMRQGRYSGELWQRRKDGEEFLCAIEASVVSGPDGEPHYQLAVLNDITQQKRVEQELRYLANFDTLTDLPNRVLLSERLSRAIVRARRERNRVALLFLDLDRFKDINDSLGHAAGDRILRAAAVRLQQTVGQHNTVARLAGDEFTVVLENLDEPEDADRIAREVIMSFEAPLIIDDRQEISISPSIGISVYPDHGQVPTELLKRADAAMYQAKAAGRRTFMRYDDAMETDTRRRAVLSGALRKVIDRGELRLVFQPRLALGASRITGAEALLRWRSPEHGDVTPAEFIPLAEASGLILEIGEWVLREACMTLGRWRQHGLDDLNIAVNVSGLQLLRGDFPDVVRRILADTGIPPQALELELTESVLMASAGQAASQLQAFRELGVSLAIDDFGTGYSSLAYLKRLPITTIKIDKEFIDDLSEGSDDAAITSTVIAMAHSLELNVVAEGVETEAQTQFLRRHGCDEIQGYWLSPPLDAHGCLGFIRRWSPAPAGRAILS